MALAPAVRLLLPVPSVEQQHAPPAATSFSPASLGSANGSYTSFSLFLHPPCHRLRKSFRPAISRVTEVEEGPQKMEREPRRTPKRLAENPPWQKKASNAASGEVPQASGGGKPHSFRPAPWQQGFREHPNAPLHEAPWQQGPVDVETQAEDNEEETRRINAEADKSAMARIVEKLRTIQQTFDPGELARTVRPSTANGVSRFKPNQNGAATGKNLSTPSVLDLDREVLNSKFPWEKDEKAEEEKKSMQEKRVRTPTRAELTIPPHELKRLRLLGVQLQERLKIGKLGVTNSIVLSIHEQWNTCELVKVKCEGSAAMSIKKTQTDLEKKTGGLVVWRAGNVIVIYRGSGYGMENGMATSVDKRVEGFSSQEGQANVHAESPLLDHRDSGDEVVTDQKVFMGTFPTTMNVNMASDSQDKRDYEMEVEGILEGLGPRYENWTGLRPLPVDADLLPPVIPNYRPPFRLVPFGVKPRLSDTELTNIRRLARPLAPHFVLGRNRGQHGLAAAIVKLWEKSEIAKIAVKKRVQNTNNEKMAEEIKRLTGGVLLSRDKFFITFYRGKDFLPQKVADALTEREAMVRNLQEQEEKTREERNIAVERVSGIQPSVAVIGKGALDVKPSWVYTMDIEEQNRLKREAAKVRRITLARQMERKLDVALKKKEKAERDRQKVEVSLKPIERPTDTETITEEERFMFRRLGLRMKAYLLLGRRGVFDGVVENMHLHWKHRELVKILVKERDGLHLQDTARMLEYESGGVLVAVVPTAKGQAIIMYRGKNYQRPAELRPRNLLTKRKALKRSLEMQRHASLSKHIQDLEEEILKIRADLRKMSQADDDELDEGFGNEYGDSSSEAESDGVLDYEQREEPLMIEDKDTGSTLSEEETDQKVFQEKMKRLERLVRLGPIYRADPLTNTERLRLRKEALSLSKASQFHVGKSNALEGLARGIRIYLLHHALVKIVVKGRGQGTSIQDLVHDLEDLTGGVLVSQEASKIIMYRGWPEGDEMPRSESLDDLSAELCDALEAEADWDDDLVEDYMAGGEVDASDNEELETEDYISGKDDDVLDDDDDGDDEEGGDQDSSQDLQLELNDSSEDGEDDAEDDFNFEMLLDGSEDEACVVGSKRDTRSVFKGEAEEMW